LSLWNSLGRKSTKEMKGFSPARDIDDEDEFVGPNHSVMWGCATPSPSRLGCSGRFGCLGICSDMVRMWGVPCGVPHDNWELTCGHKVLEGLCVTARVVWYYVVLCDTLQSCEYYEV
ncbi:hypothetical protein KI387_006786, partial [Taxus chinensis]